MIDLITRVAEFIYYFPLNFIRFFKVEHRLISRKWLWQADAYRNVCKCGKVWYYPTAESLIRDGNLVTMKWILNATKEENTRWVRRDIPRLL